MAKVEKARDDMYEDVCSLFFASLPAAEQVRNSEKFIKPIFSCPWSGGEEHCGYVLVDHGKIVGFLGFFSVQRPLNGSMEKFCNLTTWRVHENFRNESILLMMPFVRMKDCTVTGRTMVPNIFAIYQKLGFQCLDSQAYLVPTVTLGRKSTSVRVVIDLDEVRLVLPEHGRILSDDHATFKSKQLVIEEGTKQCHILFSPVKKGFFSVAHIHYISNLEVFLSQINEVKSALYSLFNIPLILVEKRFLQGRSLPLSWLYTSKYLHVFKSNKLIREDIDNLYTELVVYNTLENRFY